MISEENLRYHLLQGYKICELYVMTGASSKVISELTDVKISTVKRSFKLIRERTDDYLKFFPELGSEEDLLSFQEKVEETARNNKSIAFSTTGSFKDDKANVLLEEIVAISKKITINQEVPDETKEEISRLRVEGESFGVLAQRFHLSKNTVFRICNGKSNGK